MALGLGISSASASPDDLLGNATGADVGGVYDPPPEIAADAEAKAALAAAYYDAKVNGGSWKKFRVAYDGYLARRGEKSLTLGPSTTLDGASTPLSDKAATAGDATASPLAAAVAGDMQAASLHKRRVFNVRHFGQSDGHYCGPASGMTILTHMGAGRSEADGSVTAQRKLANDAHMRTDSHGATRWDRGDYPRGLNRWLQGTNRGDYMQRRIGRAQGFVDKVTMDLDANWLPAADTVEDDGGIHYNKHPQIGEPIGHWITIHGYDEYGEKFKYVDPSSSIWPSRSFNGGNSRNFARNFVVRGFGEVRRNGMVF